LVLELFLIFLWVLLVLHIRKVERSKQAVKMKRKKTSVEAKCKFYAVKKGHNPGIYTTWEDCRAQVCLFFSSSSSSFLPPSCLSVCLSVFHEKNQPTPFFFCTIAIAKFVPGKMLCSRTLSEYTTFMKN
jgi:hypothetical protein